MTAAAARKLLPVWQKTSSCATVGGTASVESASVCHSTKGRPVRTALFVQHIRDGSKDEHVRLDIYLLLIPYDVLQTLSLLQENEDIETHHHLNTL